MKTLIFRLRNEFIFDYEEVDIKNNNELYEKYKEKIPVLFVNGKIFAKYTLDVEKLRRKIQL